MSDQEQATQEKPTPETESKPLEFKLKAVKEIPPRKYRKGSKYDPIIEQFLKSKQDLAEISVTGKDGNYIRTQLNKRIKENKLKGITVSVINNVAYLERVK